MKKAQKQAWLHGGIGLLAGIVLMGVVTTVTTHREHRLLMEKVEAHTGESSVDHNDMTMSEMVAALQGKSGDEFDKAFVEMMIPHHQGAVEMAELARTSAKHQEIKTLADHIITSQTKEINDMYTWQKAWGYTSSDSEMMHHH